MQRARALTQALIISGTLNIGLLSTFIYSILKEKQAVVSLEVQPPSKAAKMRFTNEQVLQVYSQASFQDLLVRLGSREFVEEGYTKRDLSLSCLVAFHHFPIKKVLGEAVLQKRVITFQEKEGEKLEMIAFSGLKDEHFEAVLQFAYTEKWPLTSKGIFLALQERNPPYDQSLLEAFYTTPEFYSIYVLLQKGVPSLEKGLLADLLTSGSWDKVREVSDRLRLLQTYDLETSREILTSYALEFGSKEAISCLFQHQREYVIKRFDDEQLLALLEKSAFQPESLETLAKEIILSPRSDEVRQQAASILYSMAQEFMPRPYDHVAVLHRFFPEKEVAPIFQAMAEEEPLPNYEIHKVQEGESLWRIARRYGTTVDELRELNQLETDRLRIGKSIKVPKKPF